MPADSLGTETFTNKKPKLVGTVSLDAGDSDSDSGSFSGAGGNFTATSTQALASRSLTAVNVTKTNSIVVITGAVADGIGDPGNNRTITIFEGATDLGSLVLGNAVPSARPIMFIVIVSNPSIGNHTYKIESPENNLHRIAGLGITAQVIEIDNTQSAKNTNLING